ncbi:hypothetical protein SOVF_091540 [Spinacia oleracea]|uniref:SHSP domain-containing protein n=1 Tax=Spinacia oleracea TaxID=3562 RepID=A0A9R0JR05_SPIOL|nr:uncharacterized protein LOC110783716 [Spinacia oleracea]KNA16170.1 hypothetical protein SOVF_091540 [Spinacia oleracea]
MCTVYGLRSIYLIQVFAAKMESQVIRRRINTISAHFATGNVNEDVTAPNTHLIPLNCSSNLSTSFRRLDSRMHFGRQSSASQGYFMRQAMPMPMSSTEQGNQDFNPGVCSAKCVNKKRTSAPESPLFSRPASIQPLFSRPAQEDFNFSDTGSTEPVKQDKMLPASKCHTSAMPQEKQSTCTRQTFSSQINGIGWSPRINVIESKSSHVVTVELPGVEINDIRVEMDDKNLIVRGKRSMKWLKAAGCSNDSDRATYHRREIVQGPYQIIWPLPPGANKNSVSAELVEGILHITIPKL